MYGITDSSLCQPLSGVEGAVNHFERSREMDTHVCHSLMFVAYMLLEVLLRGRSRLRSIFSTCPSMVSGVEPRSGFNSNRLLPFPNFGNGCFKRHRFLFACFKIWWNHSLPY